MKKIIFNIFFLNIILLKLCFAQENDEPYMLMIAEFMTDSAKTGDIVKLKLKIDLSSDLLLPESIPIQGLDDLNIMGIEKDSTGIIINILATSVGILEIPELKLYIPSKDGNEILFKSDPVSLAVIPPLSQEELEKAYIKPIKDIFPVNSGLKMLPYLLVIILVVLIIIAWYIIKSRKQKQIEIAKSIPPEEVAFKQLRQLQVDASSGKEDLKEYYFRLSLIIREYMEKIRGFPAAELTSDEISLYIKLDKDMEILRLLKKADLIKFADFRATTVEREEHYKSSWKYVKETTDERLSKEQEAEV